MATKPARMGGAIWLYKRACRRRILRFLLLQRRPWSSLTHETGSFAIETPSQRIKTLCSADALLPTAAFSLHSSTGLPDSLPPSGNFKELKRASLQRRCCKCRTIFVARAVLPCTPLMITASASHAWGYPTRRMHSKRRNVLTARIWVSPICAHGSLSFQRPTPPLTSSQEPVRKKQRGRGSQRLETSELLRALPFPFREGSPVHFSQPDQRTTACCWQLQMKRWSMIKCLPWTSLWPRIITRLRLLVGRQRSPTFGNFGPRWTRLLVCWTSGLGASFYDGPAGLSGQTTPRYGRVRPRPRGFQGAAQRDRPSPTHHQRVTVAPECALAIQWLAASFKIGASDPLKTFQNMLCLMAYSHRLHVLVRSESMTVLSYINRQGGLSSMCLFSLVECFLEWVQLNLRSLKVMHVQGRLNQGADMLSQKTGRSTRKWFRKSGRSLARQRSTALPQKTTFIAQLISRRTQTRWTTTGPTYSFTLSPRSPWSRR